MTDAQVLTTVAAEFRPLLLEGDPQSIGSAVMGWGESGLNARVVRGRKMRTLGGLLDEFAAAMQFPLYFGENEDAFDECIAELENLPAGEGYVVIIAEPDQVLVDEEAARFSWLVRSLASAAHGWAQPVEFGEWWDRPAVPFHVVLAGDSVQLERATRRWFDAGVATVPFH